MQDSAVIATGLRERALAMAAEFDLPVYRVQGYHPYLLTDPDSLWVVASGAAAVFDAAVERGLPVGARRFLFTANAGEVLLQVAPKGGIPSSLFVIGIENLQLVEIPLVLLEQCCAMAGVQPQELFDGWISRLAAVLAGNAAVPATVERLNPGTGLNLESGQTYAPVRGGILWTRMLRGRAELQGGAELIWDGDAGVMPLTDGVWLRALETCELRTEQEAPDDIDVQLQGVLRLHELLRAHLNVRDAADRAAEQTRLEQRAVE